MFISVLVCIGPEQAKLLRDEYSSRSTQKGVMTENRHRRDLDRREEYARSGHSADRRNVNVDAEGYIEQIPALNAPGGLAVAGYANCRTVPAHYWFNAVGHARAMITVICKKFFAVEHPHFLEGGRLFPMLEMCAARAIAAFNDLESTYGSDHILVKMILQLFIDLKIEDDLVPAYGGP